MSDIMKNAYEKEEELRKSIKNVKLLSIEREEDGNVTLNLEDGRLIEICYYCYGGVSIYKGE